MTATGTSVVTNGVVIDNPITPNPGAASAVVADPAKVAQLEAMGLGSHEKCEQALITYSNNVESAANHLLGSL